MEYEDGSNGFVYPRGKQDGLAFLRESLMWRTTDGLNLRTAGYLLRAQTC